jgi:hypothetical protein
MIPLHLTLSGFLSYRDLVEIDFTTFDLACISGSNGAGKSSLLDAITWVLFGQARKRDDSLINLQSNTAEVSLVFSYEGSKYKVQRARSRGKTGLLEFLIAQDSGVWKPLTERTQADTQTRIEQTLRLNYDTFVNASFFLQGKLTCSPPRLRPGVSKSWEASSDWTSGKSTACELLRAVNNSTRKSTGWMVAPLRSTPSFPRNLSGKNA